MKLFITRHLSRRTASQCLALAIGAGVLAGACGGDGGSTPSAPPPATPAPPPTPPPPPPPPTCTVGLVLRAGDSCTYPGTSQTFTVNADGTATFGFLTSGNSINISSNNLTLVANRQSDGSWLIERVGTESRNRAPATVGNIPNQTLTEGGDRGTVDVSANFADPDGDTLTYRATSSRSSIVAVSVSGSQVTLTPVAAGTVTVTVTATDPGGLSASQTFAVTVATRNRAPRSVGAIPDQTLTEGGEATTIDVSARFEDPDGDDLTYRASSSRSSVVRVSVSGSDVTLTPVGGGIATVTITATDPGGESATQQFEVTVTAAPEGGIATFGVGERIPTFPEGFDAIPNVSRGGVSVSVQGGRVTIGMRRGAYLEYDDYRYTCNASQCEIQDGVVTAGEIVRTPPGESGGGETENQSPRAVGRIPDQMLTDGGSARTLDVSENFEDPDRDALSYQASSSRSSVVRVSVSGSDVTLTPRGAGTATVTVTATDPGGLSASQSVAVTVARRGGTSGSVLRDDFDDSDSLDDWEFLDARESVSGGVLRLTKSVSDRTARAVRSLDSSITEWEVGVRMGRQETGSYTASVVLRTGDARYSSIQFELADWQNSNYELSAYDRDESSWVTIDSGAIECDQRRSRAVHGDRDTAEERRNACDGGGRHAL